MKKRIFLVILATLAFGLAAGAYAYYGSSASISVAAMTCCHHNGESCPMKQKAASGSETASCCDNCECCKGGADSCAMKNGASSTAAEPKHDAASCPMKKDASAVATGEAKHDMKAAHGEGCCCPCCSPDKEKKDAPAV
jgi:hypothetical protein